MLPACRREPCDERSDLWRLQRSRAGPVPGGWASPPTLSGRFHDAGALRFAAACERISSIPRSRSSGLKRMHVLWRGDSLQRARLVSGLILFVFAATHFLNHAIGLVSIDVMQDVQQWRWVVTRSLPGTIILAGALVTHIAARALQDRARARRCACRGGSSLQLALRRADPVPAVPPHRQHALRARRVRGRTTTTSTSSRGCGPTAPSSRACCCSSCGCTAASASTSGCGSSRLPRVPSRCCCRSPSHCRWPRSAASWCRPRRGSADREPAQTPSPASSSVPNWPTPADADRLRMRTLVRLSSPPARWRLARTSCWRRLELRLRRRRSRSPTSAARRCTSPPARRCSRSAA